MNRFEILLQQMREMAASARASYDERMASRRSRELDESGNPVVALSTSSSPRASAPIMTMTRRRRARAGSDDVRAIDLAASPPDSPSRFSEVDIFNQLDQQLSDDETDDIVDDNDLFLTPLVPPRRDLTLLLDSLTLERVLFYAGAVHCRAVCRRWASVPIRSFVLLRGDQIPTTSTTLLPLLRRVELRRAHWPADCLDALIRDAPRLERLSCVARQRTIGGSLVARAGGSLHNLRSLTIDCIDADLSSEPISLAVIARGCARTLRKLQLRHVRIADVGALAELALELLDLKQVHDIDALLTGPLVTPLLSAAPLLNALTLDYRPVRGAACIGATLTQVSARFDQLRVLSLMFHRLGDALDTLGSSSLTRTLDALLLSGCTFGSGGLVGLLSFSSRLRELELFCCAVDDVERELLIVARLTNLRSLMLFDGVDATHVHLLEPLALLEDLYSDSVSLTVDAVDALGALPALRYVHLAAFDERGLARALEGPLRHLSALDFSYEQNAAAMDDAHVARLCAALPELYFIDLDGATRLSSAVLVPMARLSHLRHVNLRDADNVSHFAFDRFARFLEQRETGEIDSETVLIDEQEPSVVDHSQRALAAAAAAAAAAATSAGASPAAAAAAAAAAMAAVIASQMPAPGVPPPVTRLCTRNFPVDSWSSCVRLAKRHFARDPQLLQRRRDLFSDRTTVMQEELELVAAGGAVLAPMLGERSLEALKALARAFKQQQSN